jgi:hypothetical protein
MVTVTNGFYQFNGLCPATYKVFVDPTSPNLAGLEPTITGAGTPATDSNPEPIDRDAHDRDAV